MSVHIDFKFYFINSLLSLSPEKFNSPFLYKGLRHWTGEDDPWIEHARWSRNCVFLKQKKGDEFINLVQLAVQYSQEVSYSFPLLNIYSEVTLKITNGTC